MIKAVIIDDERHSVETLKLKLDKYCREVEVAASFTDPEEGLAHLKRNPPELLFLDIEMPRLNGFELLENLGEASFDVIFTTAYDEFGIRAIKFSALDYLLKPIHADELKAAVERHSRKSRYNLSSSQLEVLFSNIREEQRGRPGKIALATKESIEFVFPEEIVACSSDSNYTLVFLKDGRKRLISKTLKEFEELLSEFGFFRTHHSHLANLSHVREFVRADGGYLVMDNKMTLPVSRSRREELLKQF
ncbi:MAG: response regulator transcription factor [Phaeodactylibacter sp.]|nr:response regulator transcription factor [Phaeodactylibacter sp.]MCB9051230.1 response regulator transcription factor [Lewinellaceae bacterium]